MFHREVFSIWTEEQKSEAMKEILMSKDEGVYKTILVDFLRVDKSIEKYESHTRFIRKVYDKFQNSFEKLTENLIEIHDLSKINSFIELVGYTAR